MDRETSVPIDRHLRAWLGSWPPPPGELEVVSHPARDELGWDGEPDPLVGVVGPDGGVLSVSERRVEEVRSLVPRLEDVADRRWRAKLGDVLALPHHTVGLDVLRWADNAPSADELPDIGRWLPADDPGAPGWLRPFRSHDALVAFDADGAALGAVGVKDRAAHGAELAILIVPAARGRGVGKRLVAQASRRIIEEGRLPTVIYEADNAGSARLADATGFHLDGLLVLEPLPRESPLRPVARRLRRRVTTLVRHGRR